MCVVAVLSASPRSEKPTDSRLSSAAFTCFFPLVVHVESITQTLSVSRRCTPRAPECHHHPSTVQLPVVLPHAPVPCLPFEKSLGLIANGCGRVSVGRVPAKWRDTWQSRPRRCTAACRGGMPPPMTTCVVVATLCAREGRSEQKGSYRVQMWKMASGPESARLVERASGSRVTCKTCSVQARTSVLFCAVSVWAHACRRKCMCQCKSGIYSSESVLTSLCRCAACVPCPARGGVCWRRRRRQSRGRCSLAWWLGPHGSLFLPAGNGSATQRLVGELLTLAWSLLCIKYQGV